MPFKKRRKKYQVFTPKKTVIRMLDEIGYSGVSIINKTIVDISCGDGAFLKEALKRYIGACKESNVLDKDILKMVNDHIFGYEIDHIFYRECQDNLNSIINKKLRKNRKAIFKNIKNIDGLTIDKMSFDFVVGNPPYLSYKEMDEETRNYLRDNFETCKESKYDYSYAFIEKSINLLKDDGSAIIIAPINMYRIKSGKLMRGFLRNKLIKIIDVTEENIFPGVLTNPVISVFKKNHNENVVEYIKDKSSKTLSVDSFYDNELSEVSLKETGKKRFGDYYSVHNGVATLLNSAFIVSKDTDIEPAILKNACSYRELRYPTGNKMIFPYKCVNGVVSKYTEEEFKALFPKAYKHLLSMKGDLEKRDFDKNAKWFEYGRSQAITSILSDKIMVPAIISETLSPTLLSNKDIVYAGFFIVAKDEKKNSLEEAQKILSDKKLYEYIKQVGVKMNGKSYRYSVKDLENYLFDAE